MPKDLKYISKLDLEASSLVLVNLWMCVYMLIHIVEYITLDKCVISWRDIVCFPNLMF